MATVNFSVPDEIKELFNAAFAGKNRSAVIAGLMREAAERELALRRRREAVAAILKERADTPVVSTEEVLEAVQEIRR
ncbi:hypothetical protein [Geomesophilobacter sediminis]|uniref:Uncharacterized protein n=1 Tax=Geomesophilobacter sediminis TaxID=2798584 RepID=A0A8J7M297_9BACT|nr:hypothetical protein [Geomesophilobacter sediminis]MBJ6727400.1 hypothetical protein [Geomesophilobacter sediminis]